jgi:type II secretory pathway pseudopilin PulG
VELIRNRLEVERRPPVESEGWSVILMRPILQSRLQTLRRRRSAAAAFTLAELLIVMAIIILVVVLSLPAFNLISGNRSIEASENKISAYMASARAEAIGLQEPRGVIFCQPQELELFGGRDEMALPLGVGLQAIPNGTGAGGLVPAYPWPVYAVVLFDGDGRLMLDPFTIANGSALAGRLPKPPGADGVSIPQTNKLPNIGFIMFDKTAYSSQPAGNRANWLRDNAVPYVVNRYGGTLMRGE